MTKQRPLALGAVAALGLGSLFLAAPAMAEGTGLQDPTQQEATVESFDADVAQALALQAAVAQTGESPEALAQQRDAGEILIAQGGHIAILDPAVQARAPESHSRRASAPAAPIPGDPVGGSRPGAPVTIYLDFDGGNVAGTAWNDPDVNDQAEPVYAMLPAVNLDQHAIWERIAEDYAPFNVNVTITDPGADALFKTSADDATYGSHLMFTDSYPAFAEGSGGIAFIGGTGSEYLSPAFVFTQGVSDDSKFAADAGAHEIGHNFGLSHDGFGTEEYYQPQTGTWGPIMGAPYSSSLTQWSNGDYAQATNQEDDLAVITDRSAAAPVFIGFQSATGEPFHDTHGCVPEEVDPADPQPGDLIYQLGANGDCDPPGEAYTATFEFTDRADPAADDHGDDAASATVLDNADHSFSETGVIGSTGDVDVFALTTGTGELSARVEVAAVGATLNSKLTLTDSSGKVLAEDNQAVALLGDSVTGLSSAVSARVTAGTYYLAVTGVGHGDPALVTAEAANDFSSYGSLGNYRISGAAPAFAAAPVVITSPADGSAVAAGGARVEVVGTAEAGAEVTVTAHGAAASVLADDMGAWTVDVRAAIAGETRIVASSVVGGIPVDGSDTVTVVAPVAQPVITSPKSDEKLATTPTVTGTGIAGAQVTLSLKRLGAPTDAAGAAAAPASGTATVDADGSWAVPLAALTDGEYAASAVQTINSVTSAESGQVAFVIQAADADTNTDTDTDTDTGTHTDTGTDRAAGTGGHGARNADGALAQTGAGTSIAPVAGLLTAALLVAGSVLTTVALRRRTLAADRSSRSGTP